MEVLILEHTNCPQDISRSLDLRQVAAPSLSGLVSLLWNIWGAKNLVKHVETLGTKMEDGS
jgi:hypothetical protein